MLFLVAKIGIFLVKMAEKASYETDGVLDGVFSANEFMK